MERQAAFHLTKLGLIQVIELFRKNRQLLLVAATFVAIFSLMVDDFTSKCWQCWLGLLIILVFGISYQIIMVLPAQKEYSALNLEG